MTLDDDRMTENDFKGWVHAAMASVVAVMGAYNLMCWLADRHRRHGINAAVYAPLWLFEIHQTRQHWR